MTGTVELRSAELSCEVDPVRGGEIRSLRCRKREIELLLPRTPWDRVPAAPPATVDEWTRHWQGGWQLLTPNAGNESEVAGRRHGFHGDASLAAWDVLESHEHSVVLRWRDLGGLMVTRRAALVDRELQVTTRLTNDSESPTSLILAEHLILGPPLAGPGIRIDAPAARIVPLDLDSGEPLGDGSQWPVLDDEDWSSPPPLDAFTRFAVLHAPQPRRVRVSNDDAEVAVTLTWRGERLEHLWLWHEHRAARLIDDWAISCLGVEPVSFARSTGLADAIARHEAVVLAPGAATETGVSLAVD